MHSILLFIAIFLNHILYNVVVCTIFHCLHVTTNRMVIDLMSPLTNGAYLPVHVCTGISVHACTGMSEFK